VVDGVLEVLVERSCEERGEVCALEIGAESRSREGLFENLGTVIESGGLETEFECP